MKSLLLRLSVLLMPILAISPAGAQTLEEAVNMMLEREPELLAVDLDSQSSFQTWKATRGQLHPRVTVNGASGVVERDRSTDGLVTQSGESLYSNNVGISIRQLLYDGGITRNQAKADASGYDAQRYLQMSMIESRVVDLLEVYLEVIRVGQQIEAARKNVAVHRELREKLAERQRNGGIRADTSLIDGRLSLAENSLFTQELALENATWRFVLLTGAHPEDLSLPKAPKVGAKFDDVDLSHNWNYLAATAALDAAGYKEKSRKGAYQPDVYFDAGASRGEDTLGVRGRDDEVRAQIVFSWDLYRGGTNKANNHRERLQLARARELLRAASEQRDYQLRLLLAEKEGSAASTQSLEQYTDKLARVISDYEEQFRIGQKDLLNILDVRNEHFQGRSRLIDSRFNEQTVNYRILGVQGRLVERLIGDAIADYVTTGDRKADRWYSVPQSATSSLPTAPTPVASDTDLNRSPIETSVVAAATANPPASAPTKVRKVGGLLRWLTTGQR